SKNRKSWGRSRVDQETEQLVVQMAKENPGWGYDRIVGAMANLGSRLSDQTVANILRRHNVTPAPKRKQTIIWKDFYPCSHGRIGGHRLFHGGSPDAAWLDDLLCAVLHTFGEPEGERGRNHPSSGSRVDGTDGAQCDDGRRGFFDPEAVPSA